MIPTPIFRNPSETDAQRMQRVEDRLGTKSLRSKLIFGGGLVALTAFGILALLGLPQAGLVLVPLGMGLVLGGGIELFIGGWTD